MTVLLLECLLCVIPLGVEHAINVQLGVMVLHTELHRFITLSVALGIISRSQPCQTAFIENFIFTSGYV